MYILISYFNLRDYLLFLTNFMFTAIVFPPDQPEPVVETTEYPDEERIITDASVSTLSSRDEIEKSTLPSYVTVAFPEETPKPFIPETHDQTFQEDIDLDKKDETPHFEATTHTLDYITKSPLVTDTYDTTINKTEIIKTTVSVPEIQRDVTTEEITILDDRDSVETTTKFEETKVTSTTSKPDEIIEMTFSPMIKEDISTKPTIDYSDITEDTKTTTDKGVDFTKPSILKETTEFITLSRAPDDFETSSHIPEVTSDRHEDEELRDVPEVTTMLLTTEKKTDMEPVVSVKETKLTTSQPYDIVTTQPTVDKTTISLEILNVTSKITFPEIPDTPYVQPNETELVRDDEITTQISAVKSDETEAPYLKETTSPDILSLFTEDSDKLTTEKPYISTTHTSEDLTKSTTESIALPEISTSSILSDITRTSEDDTITKKTDIFTTATQPSMMKVEEITERIDENITIVPPGEGLCISEYEIYENGQEVPVSDSCQEECWCRNSVIVCTAVKCQPAPPAFFKCNVRQSSNECCPVYECGK